MKKNNPLASVLLHTAAYIIMLGFLFLGFGVAIWYYPMIINLIVIVGFIFLGGVSLMFGLNMLTFYSKAQKVLSKIKFD